MTESELVAKALRAFAVDWNGNGYDARFILPCVDRDFARPEVGDLRIVLHVERCENEGDSGRLWRPVGALRRLDRTT